MVKKNVQPMKENQLFLDKAIALYHYYHNRYGYGDIYTSVKIDRFLHKFDFTNLCIDEQEFSMGILHQRMLVTVIFCSKPNAFKKDQEAFINHTIYAGKLGPRELREDFFSDKFTLLYHPEPGRRIPFLSSYDIISNTGQLNLKGEIPENLNQLPILEIVFDAQGRISAIKKP